MNTPAPSKPTKKPAGNKATRLPLDQVAALLDITTEEVLENVASTEGFPTPDAAQTFLESEILDLLQPLNATTTKPAPPVDVKAEPVAVQYLEIRLPFLDPSLAFATRPRKHYSEDFSEQERDQLAQVVAGAAAAGLTYQGQSKRHLVDNIYGLMKWFREQISEAVTVKPNA